MGKTTAQVIVDPRLPIIKVLDENHHEELLREHLRYFYSQTYFMFDDPNLTQTQKDILNNPLSKKIWLEILSDPLITNYRPQEYRKVVLKFKTPLGIRSIPMYFNRESLLKYSRFEVVEYFPESRFLNVFKRLI